MEHPRSAPTFSVEKKEGGVRGIVRRLRDFLFNEPQEAKDPQDAHAVVEDYTVCLKGASSVCLAEYSCEALHGSSGDRRASGDRRGVLGPRHDDAVEGRRLASERRLARRPHHLHRLQESSSPSRSLPSKECESRRRPECGLSLKSSLMLFLQVGERFAQMRAQCIHDPELKKKLLLDPRLDDKWKTRHFEEMAKFDKRTASRVDNRQGWVLPLKKMCEDVREIRRRRNSFLVWSQPDFLHGESQCGPGSGSRPLHLAVSQLAKSARRLHDRRMGERKSTGYPRLFLM